MTPGEQNGPRRGRVPPPPSAEMTARFDALADLIAAAPHNLVSRRERGTLLEVYIPECRAVAEALDPRAGSAWMDLGTGGGLPGLVLAVARPEVHWTLVDSTTKKVDAVRRFAGELGLANVSVVAGRAESLAREAHLRAAFDGVVSRAVARLVVVAELSRGFVPRGGVVAAIKGPRWRDELLEAEPALPALGLELESVVAVPAGGRGTVVVTMRAAGPPPRAIPRGIGVPGRAPLGRRQAGASEPLAGPPPVDRGPS